MDFKATGKYVNIVISKLKRYKWWECLIWYLCFSFSVYPSPVPGTPDLLTTACLRWVGCQTVFVWFSKGVFKGKYFGSPVQILLFLPYLNPLFRKEASGQNIYPLNYSLDIFLTRYYYLMFLSYFEKRFSRGNSG